VRRAPINRVEVDADNPNWVVVEQVMPPDVGGWTIREIGVFDSAGDLIAYGNYPETYKPTLDEGSGRTQTVRMVLQVSDTAAVTLRVDPSVVLATRKYVDDGDAAVAQALQEHAASRNHPLATTTGRGMVEKATTDEAKAGAADKFPDASGVRVAIKASRINDQFLAYSATRVYTTGEIVRGSDGQFYEFYDRDLAGTIEGVDPTNVANRPHIWMEWHGVRPGTVIEWRSEILPEGYVENDGSTISRSDYRRIFAALGTTYGAGNGSTTFLLPDDRGEFKRGLDRGRGIDAGRALGGHQLDALQNIIGSVAIADNSSVNGAVGGANGAFFGSSPSGRVPNWSGIDVAGGRSINLNFDASRVARASAETRPRNNAVIYLTKI
jgi:phage-related tail fiber protein